MGRRATSALAFSAGDVVLREEPLLVFDSTRGDATNLWAAYSKCTVDEQRRVLDMYHPDRSSFPQLLNQASFALNVAEHDDPDVILLHRLLLIVNFNSHSFNGGETNYEGELVIGSSEWNAQVKLSALFDAASKVEHSCCPSVRSSTKTGAMVYTATRDIKEGDFVTFSYLGPALDISRAERRATLRREKRFDCECDRCQGLDLNQPQFCSNVNTAGCCPGLVLQCGKSGSWICGECDTRTEDRDVGDCSAREKSSVVDSLEKLKDQIVPQTPEQFKKLQQLAHDVFPFTHSFWVSFWESLASYHASVAVMVDKHTTENPGARLLPGMSVKSSRLQSAIANIESVAWKNEMQRLVTDRAGGLPPQFSRSLAASKVGPCGGCGTATEKKCSKCLCSFFCGRDCQVKCWPGHKGECKAFLARCSDNGGVPTSAAGAKKRIARILSSAPPSNDSVMEAFYAGMDLEKAGEGELAAMLFEPYEQIIRGWLQPGDPDVEIVRGIVARKR